MLNFKNLNLNPLIVSALEKKGYSTPTPIQAQAIPHLLEGKDLLGIAQTGTGKTAAFSLPIIDRLAKNESAVGANQIRALILTPTRELAVQIAENVELYGKGLKLKHAVIFGGVSELNQIKALKAGLDIVIATPGRLLDLFNQGHINFSQIEIFVLDEADRMLDMGFITDVKKIMSKLPAKRQSLLFSATMPDVINGLANSILKDPVKVEITPQSTTVERINQKIYMVDKSHKLALLLDVVIKEDVVATLVFCKTKHGANKVFGYLENHGVAVNAIHGNKSQNAREKALKDLRSGKIKVLIATDIAARGIDVSSISHVVNYDIPLDPESYVHRIGRTARAGREGCAISFCDPSEKSHLRAIEKVIAMKIPVDESHPFHGKPYTPDASQGRMLSRGNGDKNAEHKSSEKRSDDEAGNKRSGNQFGNRISRGQSGDRRGGDRFGNRSSDGEMGNRRGGGTRFGARSGMRSDTRSGARSEPRSGNRADGEIGGRRVIWDGEDSTRTRGMSSRSNYSNSGFSDNRSSSRFRSQNSDRFSSRKSEESLGNRESIAKKILRKTGLWDFGKKSFNKETNGNRIDDNRSSENSRRGDSFGRNRRAGQSQARPFSGNHRNNSSRNPSGRTRRPF